MHIPTNHLRKLFAEWFSLLLQIETDFLRIEAAVTNRDNYCKSGHNNILLGEICCERFSCHYEILKNNDLLPNHKSFLRRVREISLT